MVFDLKKGAFVVDELRNVSIKIGKIEEEEEEWEEAGPTIKPHILDLREWDKKLLERYEPFYAPMQDFCNLCTMGPCDLSMNKRGACGIDLKTQKARLVAIACCIGASAHCAHGRHLLDYAIEEFGEDYPLDFGSNVNVEMPNTRLVFGIKPKTLGDLDAVMSYCEQEIVRVLHTTHTGNEGSYYDYESKALHVSMIDHVAMEIADAVQIVAYGYPKAEPNTPLVETGFGIVDRSKPVIVVIGHNVMSARPISDLIEEKNFDMELAGLCCTAHDVTRYNPKAKIFGPIYYQLRVIRAGLPDVVIVDEQCIKTDVPYACGKMGIPVIVTSEAASHGFEDRTNDDVDKIVNDLLSGKTIGVFIRYEKAPEKIAEVAVRVAQEIFKRKDKSKLFLTAEELNEEVEKCTQCMNCVFACPIA